MTTPDRRAGFWSGAMLVLTAGMIYAVTLVGAEPTNSEPGIGVMEKTGTVEAFGLAVVVDEKGQGVLVGTLLNYGRTDDRLRKVSVTSERGSIDVQTRADRAVLPVGESIQLHERRLVTLASEHLRPGFMVEMRFDFLDSFDIATLVPVERPTGPYKQINP